MAQNLPGQSPPCPALPAPLPAPHGGLSLAVPVPSIAPRFSSQLLSAPSVVVLLLPSSLLLSPTSPLNCDAIVRIPLAMFVKGENSYLVEGLNFFSCNRCVCALLVLLFSTIFAFVGLMQS